MGQPDNGTIDSGSGLSRWWRSPRLNFHTRWGESCREEECKLICARALGRKVMTATIRPCLICMRGVFCFLTAGKVGQRTKWVSPNKVSSQGEADIYFATRSASPAIVGGAGWDALASEDEVTHIWLLLVWLLVVIVGDIWASRKAGGKFHTVPNWIWTSSQQMIRKVNTSLKMIRNQVCRFQKNTWRRTCTLDFMMDWYSVFGLLTSSGWGHVRPLNNSRLKLVIKHQHVDTQTRCFVMVLVVWFGVILTLLSNSLQWIEPAQSLKCWTLPWKSCIWRWCVSKLPKKLLLW